MELTPTQKLILAELQFGPSTWHDFADVTKRSEQAIRTAVRRLHELKLIRVCAWERSGNIWIRVWALRTSLSAYDVKKPTRISGWEKTRRWRERNPEKFRASEDARLARLRERNKTTTGTTL